MPSNNSKYTPEIREQTAKYIIETGTSATSVAEEMGIDTNTVCKWVREYRRKNNDDYSYRIMDPNYSTWRWITTYPSSTVISYGVYTIWVRSKY